MKNKQFVAFLFFALIFPSFNSWARWTWSPQQGKFVNSAGEAQNTAEELYQYGEQFHKEKDLDEAISQMKAVVEKYPNSRVGPDAQYKVGAYYEEKGDFLKAFQAYKTLLSSYPQNRNYDEVVERLFRIGNAFLSGKKARLWGMEILSSLPRAIEVFKFIVDQAPFSTYGDKASFQLGLAYKQAGRFEEAVQTFQSIIDQHPKSDLVPDTRFQIAETSFQRSAAQNRDQRALDDAAQEVDRFLSRYPDSNTSEKATKLKQVIDETNAEKNYRTGLYYEKDRYIQSALIYYTDAAERYPQTKWGMKAKEKITSLKEPATYHAGKDKQIQEEQKVLEAKIKVLAPDQKIEKERLERKVELLRKHQKNLEKEKKYNLSSIHDDINRRESELKEKYKNLQKKKKLNKNPTDDFKTAIQRWEASIRDEESQLDQEKKKLAGWREDLRVPENRFGIGFIPFLSESSSDLDRVRSMSAKELFKLSEERKALLDEKELLYKHRGEVRTRVDQMVGSSSDSEEEGWMKSLDPTNGEVQKHQKSLGRVREKIKSLESQIDAKQSDYEKHFGQSLSRLESLYKVPAQVIAQSTSAVSKTFYKSLDKSFELLNPFDGVKSGSEPKNLQGLLEYQMHLKEKISNQQNLEDTLSLALNEELAIKEQKRLMQGLGKEAKKEDPIQLRKDTKKVQKKIRAKYQEIEDLDHQKSGFLKNLNSLYKEREARSNMLVKTGHAVTKPLAKTVRLMRAFFVGLPNSEVEVTDSVEKLPENSEIQAQARSFKQEIELRSLLIDAKSQEIIKDQKQLEILKAKASFAGGLKFSSVLIDVPYEFMGEAIENARKMIPKKGREQALSNRLQKETQRLQELKKEMRQLDDQITRKEAEGVAPSQTPALTSSADIKPSESKTQDTSTASMTRLKREIETLDQDRKTLHKAYEEEKKTLKNHIQTHKQENKEQKKREKVIRKEIKKKDEATGDLRNELHEIEGHLQHMIQKESKLEVEETSILEKRISHIDKVISAVSSKALSQDLLQEREQMQGRLSQLILRRDFLSKEIERFQPSETGKKVA
ncbi:MAG: outer membrane protein assembly factor BamD [Candidatus Omnitrophica bacterium]|nr:outer membrane protein assembly factor BamD [Candidatus Omnitrophota bacterium]